MKKVFISYFCLFTIIYLLTGILGYNIFKNHKKIMDVSFLKLFDVPGNVYFGLTYLLITFAAAVGFLFVFKALKETILKLIFGDKVQNAESDYSSENIFGTLGLIGSACLISGYFIVTKKDGMEIIGYVSNYVTPFTFMIIPLAVHFYVSKNAKSLIILILMISLYFINIVIKIFDKGQIDNSGLKILENGNGTLFD